MSRPRLPLCEGDGPGTEGRDRCSSSSSKSSSSESGRSRIDDDDEKSSSAAKSEYCRFQSCAKPPGVTACWSKRWRRCAAPSVVVQVRSPILIAVASLSHNQTLRS